MATVTPRRRISPSPARSHYGQAVAFLCLVAVAAASASAPAPPRDSLGIAPQDEAYYQGGVIKCRDGSGKFPRDRLNDDFCDCPDGTDEPGTSACPEGKFYCRNVGHAPLLIFSSRVNDGICDCCDGSDEYEGKVDCPNTCWKAGKAAREKLIKKIATYKEGVVTRNQEIAKAKQEFSKDETELSDLKNEEKLLQGLVDKLKEQKERIEKAEEEERLKKEQEEKRLKDEAERQAAAEEKTAEHESVELIHETKDTSNEEETYKVGNAHEDHEHGEADLPNRGDKDELTNPEHEDDVPKIDESSSDITDPHLSYDHTKVGGNDAVSEAASSITEDEKDHGSTNTEGLSREELGRLVASRWTGEKTSEASVAMDEEQSEDDFDSPEPGDDEHYHRDTSENYDFNHRYDDDFDDVDDEFPDDHHESVNSHDATEEYTASGRPTWLDKLQQTVQNVFQAFNFFKTPVNISEASLVRKEYTDASSKLHKLQSRISSLTEKLKYDYGKEKEFYSFYDQCFENKQNKYVYKVCPYKKASQVEGHSTTQLGRWDKFEDSYRVMLFSNGDRCWNGPDRSLKVRLRCGLKNELTDVDEPSRCEYTAVLSTPAICTEDKLKELQQKLDNLKTSQPQSHDEL